MEEVIITIPVRKTGAQDPVYIEGGIVRELVRCRDCWKREFDNCPFNEHTEYQPEDNFFCAEGEKTDYKP